LPPLRRSFLALAGPTLPVPRRNNPVFFAVPDYVAFTRHGDLKML
jgi:hypothetical protein